MDDVRVQCCIVGGGPAGMMLGYLLARAGVEVAVLEKHGDFLRDFRGDTVHPSTLQIMYELGLLDAFLQLKHSEARSVAFRFEGVEYPLVDFTHLPTICKFTALMPQWDFLNFLSEEAKKFPQFRLLMNTTATNLVRENGRVTGVRAQGMDGAFTIASTLVVGADGRHSTIRRAAQLPLEDIGAPMDVLWMRLSRKAGDPQYVLGNISHGTIFVMIDRDDYWQCAYILPKGGLGELKAEGIEAVREKIAEAVPFMRDRVGELSSFDDLSLLVVTVDRLRRWYGDGVLCIGDAAHAMSPIGGVGINLAIQDAVASANILAKPLLHGTLATRDLLKVQQRRMFPTRVVQGVQVFIQNKVLSQALAGKTMKPPALLHLFQWFPLLRRIPARLAGMGPRPEHVRSPLSHQ